jgi:iron complex outermembrane receptor protein
LSADTIFDDHGGRRFEGDITGRLAGPLDGRFVAVIEDGDTFKDFIEHKRTLLAPQIAAQLGDRVRVRAQYTYDNFRYVPDNGPGINEDLIFRLPVERSVQEPDLGFVRAVNQQARLDIDVALATNWTLRFGAFGHRSRLPDGNAEIDPDVTLFDTTIGRVYITTIEPGNNGAEDGMLTLQVLGRFDTGPLAHNMTAAIDSIDNRSKFDYAYYEFAPLDYAAPRYTRGRVVPAPDSLLFSGEGAFKSTIEAAYFQDLIGIGDRWKLLVGARRENIKTTGYADPAAKIETNKTDASKTTPRFGVVYDFDDSLTFYASYSEAFVPNYGLSFAGEPFEPEQSRSYEIGMRKQIGNHLLLTTALYDIEKENILVVDPQHDAFNINAGVARSKGVEAELQGRLTDNWRASLGAAYNDAEITKSSDELFPVGDTLPAAAHLSALANSRYSFTGALEGLTLGANASYTGSRPYMLPNTQRDLDAYVNVNVFATYAITDAFEVQLNVNNLTDERILLANGYGRVQFEPTRTVIASFRYRMGSLVD